MRIIFFLSACIIFSLSAAAQTKIIDSLKRHISFTTNPEEKLRSIFNICEQRHSLSSDTLYQYAQQAKYLATSLHQRKQILLSEYYIAISLEKKGLFDSSLDMVNEKIKNIQKEFQADDIARKYSYLKGALLLRHNKPKDAIGEFYTLLLSAEESRDTLSQIAAKGAIGWAYMEMNQNREAVEWYYKTLNISNNSFYKKYLIATYSNMAAAYGALQQYDSVEYYINLAIITARKEQVLTFLANALNLKATLFMYTNRGALAEDPLNEALQIRQQIGDPYYVVSDMAQFALYYAQTGKADKGIALSKQGIKIAEELNIASKLPLLYFSLAQCYKAKKDLENYSIAIERHIAINDSMHEANSAEALAQLETKYEVQQKENIIISQKLDLIKKNYLFYGSLFFILLLSILGYVLFNTYRKKEKAKLANVIKEEKLMSQQAIKQAEENERKRIAADLHDNLGAYAASIASNIDHVMYRNQSKSNVAAALEELRNNSQSMVAQLNDTIWALNKDALSLTTISDRLKIFVQRLKPSYPRMEMEIQEKIIDDLLFSPFHAFQLFQIVKEGIINAVKHSEGNNIVVMIENNSSWKIAIKDDGKGFQEINDNGGGNGLLNMKERAATCGWRIIWLCDNNKGITVEIVPTLN